MNVVKHTKYIWELEDFIPHNEIDYFLDMFDFHNPKLHSDFRNKGRNNDTYVLDDYPDIDSQAWKWVNAANEYYIKNNQWIYYNWDKTELIRSSRAGDTVWKGRNIVRMYNENDSYEWHSDHSLVKHFEFSIVTYLNDDFDGGETKFMNDKIMVSPKKGSVVFFPVDHYHIHKSVKVSSGVKKILWNCIYRNQIRVMSQQPYLTAVNAPRTSKACIW